ncbi:MAG TPA: N-acetylmuramoyl-L-alanine amidase [Anaerolineales bacterium]|nr:N-acetylmuramoyl-L-alanine amidase [Anaerolineales bacterium]
MRVNNIHRLVTEEGDDFRIAYFASPNPSPKPQLPERTLIIHAPTSASVSGAASPYLQKPAKGFLGTSMHLILGRDGKEIIQTVPFHTGAMHAFGYNGRSIGMQLQYPGELLEKGHAFQLRRNYGDNEYILASGLSSSRYGYWPLYPRAQLDSLLAIAMILKEPYNITDVVAKDEVLATTHPGPAFPIIQFREKLLGITDRSILLQETSRNVSLLGQPGEDRTLLSATPIPPGTPVSVINEKDEWYLVAVVEEVGGNPWLIGWVEKSAVRVKTDFMPVVRPDHYLVTAEGRRFQEITPHQNGYEPTKRNVAPKYIIMHFTTGTKMDSTIAHFKSPSAGVSTHLLIGRDGRVVQFLPFDRIAYHCGYSWWERQSNLNKFSIGIELDNAGLLRKGPDGQWMSRKIVIPREHVEQAVHWKQIRSNDPRRFPGWEKFPEAQLQVALNIVKALVQRYPSIVEILGHDDVNLPNRYDPGPLFPLKQWRQELFGREEPDIEIFTINRKTDLFSNIFGRLPNVSQKLHEAMLPANSVVKVIRQDDHLSLVTVLKTSEPKLRRATGWIRTNSLTAAIGGMVKSRKKKKNTDVVEKRTTKGRQQFFRRGKNPPTPKLLEGPFPVGTRVRIQQIKGEWTLVVVLDTVKGRTGLEGWIQTELLSPEVIP